jgi:hypothetical protein
METQLSGAERYWREAARVRSQATQARDEEVRETLLGIARQYEELAAAAEEESPVRLSLSGSGRLVG